MTKRNTYRVVSDTLNMVLFVKGFTLEQEQNLYNSIRDHILSSEDPITITNYKQFVVKKFLIDYDAFCDQSEKEGDDFEDSIDAAYEAIIGIYPPFSLEFICQDLNTDTFFSGVKGKLLSRLKEQVLAQQPVGDSTPIALSSIEDISHVEQFFKENIVGQRDAIDSLVKALKLMASGLSKHSSFLFVGPTGVGKTQLAKLLGERYSRNFYKVNCAEFAGGHEYAKLIGSPPGYVGHTDKSLLAEKAEHSNKWVFLFDEIEKAHHKLYDFLLSLLDDGTCTDNMGEVLDFSESIFVFTSNQGVSDIKRNTVGFDRKSEVEDKVTDEVIRNSIKKHFSPEFLNRLDDVVLFNSLNKEQVRQIAELQLEDIPIIKTKSLVDFVVEGGYSQEYGARNIARFIKNHVSIHIADAILNKRVPKDPDVYYKPRVSKGEVKIIDTKKYETSSL
jgi:ATP-dependent Clp protease ATP-binding subunit ClpA